MATTTTTTTDEAPDPFAHLRTQWAIYLPDIGMLLVRRSRWETTWSRAECSTWKTKSGADKALAKLKAGDLGSYSHPPNVKAAVDGAVLGLWPEVSALCYAAETRQMQELTRERRVESDLRFKALMGQLTRDGISVTDDAGGRLVDTLHDVEKTVADVVRDVNAGACDTWYVGESVHRVRATVAPARLPGVFEALAREHPGRLPADAACVSCGDTLGLGCEQGCKLLPPVERGSFVFFVELVRAEKRWVSWWLCWRDPIAGLFPDDGGPPLLQGRSANDLRLQALARRRVARST